MRSLHREKTLYEQTYDALRQAILSGEVAAGDRLVETQLAEKLQVSRTPIREALRQLQREALVTAEPNGGLRVTTISILDAVHLYDCRLGLERISVQGACAHATPSQLQNLELCVVQAEKLAGQPSSGLEDHQLLEIDYRFHRLLAESAANPWLVALLDQVFDKMALLRMQTTRHNPGVLEIRTEHRQIYEAVSQQNAEFAMQAIQDHLAASRVRVVQEIQKLQLEGASMEE